MTKERPVTAAGQRGRPGRSEVRFSPKAQDAVAIVTTTGAADDGDNHRRDGARENQKERLHERRTDSTVRETHDR